MLKIIKLSITLYIYFQCFLITYAEKINTLDPNDFDLLDNSIGFIENKGQISSDAIFYCIAKNNSILIFKDRIVLDFFRYDSNDDKYFQINNSQNQIHTSKGNLLQKTGIVISLEFLDFNKDFEVETVKDEYSMNIFKDGKEISGIKKYSKIKLRNFYDNIDLVFCFDNGKFRFDLILNENANPDNIKFKIIGGDKLNEKVSHKLASKSIIEVNGDKGKVYFGEITSFYTNGDHDINTLNNKEFVYTDYKLEDNIISFKLSKYDNNRKLVIDPVVYSTFFGGLDIDEITGIVKDGNEDIIITGWTRSENFITTPGSYDTLFYSETDSFVSKFRLVSVEKKLIFSTLIGGNADDYSKSISVDPDGNIFIGGETESFDYPVKNTPYSQYLGLKDGFISKFSNDGTKLLYSSYFGGSKPDRINSIAAGGAGEIYITGGTFSNDIPITITYNDNNPNNKGLEEAFITKFYPSGSIQYSYLISSLGFEYGSVISLNEKAGMLVVGGQTNSPDLISFPKTGDNKVIDYIYNGGQDIFLACFSHGLGTFNFCTFLGGSGDDLVRDILIDDEGNIYVAGETSTKNASVNPSVISTDFRITNTAYQKKNNGAFDAFLMVLNRNGTKLIGSTFVGGKNNDSFLSMDFNNNKTSVFLTGYTQSPDFPKTNSDENERYIAKKDIIISNLTPDCSNLIFSTIIGASGDDVANVIVIDKFEGINIIGSTSSEDFPLYEPIENKYYGGVSDGFVYRRLQKNLKLTVNLNSIEICQNENIYLSWQADGFEKGHQFFVEVSTDNGISWTPIVSNYDRFEYIWKVPSDFPSGSLNKIRVFSPSGIVAVSTGNFIVNSSPRLWKIELKGNENIFCEGDSVEIVTQVEGEQLKFQWEKDGKTLPSQTMQNLKLINLNLEDEGSYSLNITGKCKPVLKSPAIKIYIKPKTKIISNIENRKAKINENVEFSISAKGLKLSYEWQKNGIKIMNQSDSIFRLYNVNLNSQGYYRCIVKGECGSDTSNNVYLQVDTSISSIFYYSDLSETMSIKSLYNKFSNDFLEIESQTEADADIIITDLQGKQIFFLKDYRIIIGKNKIMLNFDELNTGIFSVTIKNSSFTKRKLILLTK